MFLVFRGKGSGKQYPDACPAKWSSESMDPNLSHSRFISFQTHLVNSFSVRAMWQESEPFPTPRFVDVKKRDKKVIELQNAKDCIMKNKKQNNNNFFVLYFLLREALHRIGGSRDRVLQRTCFI